MVLEKAMITQIVAEEVITMRNFIKTIVCISYLILIIKIIVI